jgi:N-carbamoyl-L-amino-acid hydrolase
LHGEVTSTRAGDTYDGSDEAALPPLRIDNERLCRRLDELAAVGAVEGTSGCTRLALTPEDGEARDLVVTWMRDLGMEVAVDGVGNVVAMLAGTEPLAPVMTGSHIDTVRSGGRYDGNLGVLAGLEVVETLLDAGVRPRRPVAVAFFTDEEGSRFAPDMLGSLVYVGGLPLEEALGTVGIDGAVLGDELDAIGYRGWAPCPGPAPHAFVELHIEQGPVLEAEGIDIGVVTGVQGISWTEYTVTGQANHAGTTPMRLRHDAGYVANRIAVHVRDVTRQIGSSQVGTVGTMALRPDLVNVVASSAVFTVDLRNTDEHALRRAEEEVTRFAAFVAESEGCRFETRTLARFEPVDFDNLVIGTVERAAAGRGLSHMRMPSGAGHDAQMLARVCPTARIFVPSEGGISHNPAEHTTPDQIEAGANVLLDVLVELAGVTGP